MKLILLRHGQSEADILKVCEGWANYNLTELGCKQARATCNYLAENYIFDKIYVSTLNRAIQTAEYLAANTHLSLNKTDELKEFNNGLRAKLPYNEAYAKYPNVPTPIHTSNYEQETELHFRMRAESFLSKVITENDSKSTIAIVSHGGMIMRLYESFLKLPMNSNVKFTSGEACFHEWELTDGQRFINKANCCVYK